MNLPPHLLADSSGLAARGKAELPGHSIRVVLVDDHPVVRAGVKVLLSAESDLEVVGEASDGQSAVRMVSEVECDVLLMDLSMPGLGGAEATKQVLAAAPSVRILALTAMEEVSFARLLIENGAAGYALKRSACEELVRAIRIVAAGDTYVDPVLAAALMTTGRKRYSPAGIPMVSLSEREAEVIRLIARGYTSKEMAQDLGLSPRTLETYKARAMSKLNLRSRAELIRYAMRSGWLRDS